MQNDAALTELYFKVIKEAHESRDVSHTYLFGQTLGNQDSSLGVAASLEGILLLPGAEEAASGFPGFNPWKKVLTEKGVPSERIIAVPGGFYREAEVLIGTTLSEAKALVAYLKAEKIDTVQIL